VGSPSLIPLMKKCPECLGEGQHLDPYGSSVTCDSCDGLGELLTLDQVIQSLVQTRHELRTIRRQILAQHWYEISAGDLACTTCRTKFPCATVTALSVTLP
jgi:DnaJ-class molecular chaperone